MTCETCRFWERWGQVMMADDRPRWLGHCEPERHLGGEAPINVTRKHHCGLTAADYSCPEWKERDE